MSRNTVLVGQCVTNIARAPEQESRRCHDMHWITRQYFGPFRVRELEMLYFAD
jgi:hypothetical protein